MQPVRSLLPSRGMVKDENEKSLFKSKMFVTTDLFHSLYRSVYEIKEEWKQRLRLEAVVETSKICTYTLHLRHS